MNETTRHEPGMPAPSAAQPSETAPPAITSKALLAGGKEVTILHGDRIYRLKLTAADKLILTK